MIKKLSISVMCLTLLAACAVSPPMPLTKQEQHELGDVSGTLFIPQSGLLVTVAPTDASAGGLLGVLIAAGIDAARRANAESNAAPMLERLRDYDFRTVMKQASDEAVAKIPEIKFSGALDVDTVGSNSQKRIVFDKSTASAVLFVDVAYQLQSGNLYASANAIMFRKSDKLTQFRQKPSQADPLDKGNAIYRRTFNFSKQNVTAADIKSDLTEAAQSLASQLAADLNHPL